MANESGATDLSNLRKVFNADQAAAAGKPATTEADLKAEQAFANLSEEEQAALTAKAAEQGVSGEIEEPATPVRTAFLVVINADGEAFATTDLDFKVQRAHQPSADDIFGACASVQRDITVQMTAGHVMMGLQQQATAMQQQMQDRQMAQHLASQNIRVPGQ